MGPCDGTFFRNVKRKGDWRCSVSFSPQTRKIFEDGFEKERGTAPHRSFKAEAAS
jgi:hypothetical protein